jgi:hypothetical protein
MFGGGSFGEKVVELELQAKGLQCPHGRYWCGVPDESQNAGYGNGGGAIPAGAIFKERVEEDAQFFAFVYWPGYHHGSGVDVVSEELELV